MHYSLFAVTAFLIWAASLVARAEIAVVVNPDSGVTQMTRDEVVNIYMGRYQGLPSGVTAFPVDLEPARAAFYERLVGKTQAEINSYWARLVFSGRASPPRRVPDAAAVLEAVADNKGAIGYLDRADIDGERVRIVLELGE